MGGGSLSKGNRFLQADQGHKDSKHYEEECFYKVDDAGPDGLHVYHLHGLRR